MPQTPDPSPRLRSPPLVYVLALVQFSAVLQMDRYIPAIQDQLRRRGFPLHSESEQQSLTFSSTGMSVRGVKNWSFTDRERRHGIIISDSFAVLETTRYTSFDDFHTQVLVTLNVLSEQVGPLVVERIGLRYVNVVQPQSGHSFDEILESSLAGPRSNFPGMTETQYQAELRGLVGKGTLTIRSSAGAPGAQLPPDLLVMLEVNPKARPEAPYRFLDIDHSQVGQSDFDAAELGRRFTELHAACAAAFRAAITDLAYQEWA